MHMNKGVCFYVYKLITLTFWKGKDPKQEQLLDYFNNTGGQTKVNIASIIWFDTEKDEPVMEVWGIQIVF